MAPETVRGAGEGRFGLRGVEGRGTGVNYVFSSCQRGRHLTPVLGDVDTDIVVGPDARTYRTRSGLHQLCPWRGVRARFSCGFRSRTNRK